MLRGIAYEDTKKKDNSKFYRLFDGIWQKPWATFAEIVFVNQSLTLSVAFCDKKFVILKDSER